MTMKVKVIILVILISSLSRAHDQSQLIQILAQMPANNQQEYEKLTKQLLQLDRTSLLELCDMLVPPGVADDSNIRYALNGLATFAGKNVSARECVESIFIEAISNRTNNQVRHFLISQLEWIGTPKTVKALAPFIADSVLYEPTIRTLTTIGGESVVSVFLDALESSKQFNTKSLIKALGTLAADRADAKIVRFTEQVDRQTRYTALWALANMGSLLFENAAEREINRYQENDRKKISTFKLLYAQKLVQKGHKDKALSICQSLITSIKRETENIACSALELLFSIKGKESIQDLYAALDTDFPQFWGQALKLVQQFPEEDITLELTKILEQSPSLLKVQILHMLGKRRDETALPALRKAIHHPDQNVRIAAITAGAQVGGNRVLPALVDVLKKGNALQVRPVQQVLSSYIDRSAISTLADAYPDMPVISQVVILHYLSAKHATEFTPLVIEQTRVPNDSVQIAAFQALGQLVTVEEIGVLIDLLVSASDENVIRAAQDAVVVAVNQIQQPEIQSKPLLSAIQGKPDSTRLKLLPVLAQIGGSNALEYVIVEIQHENPDIQKAAVRTLANWKNLSALNSLFEIASNPAKQSLHAIALNGYVRLIRESHLPVNRKYQLMERAMKIANNTREKSTLLTGLADIRIPESLHLVDELMLANEIREPAARTAVRIATPQRGSDSGLLNDTVIPILLKAIYSIKAPYAKKEAEQHLTRIQSGGFKLAENIKQPPCGFIPLFNGKNLDGWKGLAGKGGSPIARANMTPLALETDQMKADSVMFAHWSIADGVLVFDGKGSHLCTERDYEDFELMVDWKIGPEGDSGIYLRGTPQVQIWDPAKYPEGSGGLYNNKEHPSKPLVRADNPVGEWNTFRIKMVDERVNVHLNDVLVVDNTVMENYWDRSQPIFPSGQIELQSHGSRLYFENIFIREIPHPGEWRALFNGRNFDGWTGATNSYYIKDGKIICPEDGGGNLYFAESFKDFILRFEFKLTPGANNGLAIRAPMVNGSAAYKGMEIQILENTAEKWKDLKPYQYHGSVYGVAPAKRGHLKPVGEWNFEEVIVRGRDVTVNLNGITIVDMNLDKARIPETLDHRDHPGLSREQGHIGFLGHGSHVEFRNIFVKELVSTNN